MKKTGCTEVIRSRRDGYIVCCYKVSQQRVLTTFIVDSPAYVDVNIFSAEMHIWKQWYTTSCKQKDKFVMQSAFCCLNFISISTVDISDVGNELEGKVV